VSTDGIAAVRKAIEFDNPDRVPIELVEVPGIWDDYGALPRSACPEDFPPLQCFDAIQAIYSWVFTERGTDAEGNRLRVDEWGCLQKVPRSGDYSYLVVEEPLRDWDKAHSYRFPDPSAADPWFTEIAHALKRYPGKFVDAFIDPGVTLVALNIRGYENLLVDYYQDMKRVRWLFDGIWEYQKEIVKKWKRAGAHAVSLYEEWATQGRMYVPPEWWREHMKPFYSRAIDFIHQQGLYAGMGLDGSVLPILDDLKEIGLDILDNRQPVLLGIDNLARAGGGKLCIKASNDMQLSLPSARAGEIRTEAQALARRLGRERGGGFIGLVFKWDRIRLPIENVLASYEAFRQFTA
jgi:uroporphyrinogen decarboxylase